jgi:hypothetical protein
LAATGAPNLAVFMAIALGFAVIGACLLRTTTVLRQSER